MEMSIVKSLYGYRFLHTRTNAFICKFLEDSKAFDALALDKELIEGVLNELKICKRFAEEDPYGWNADKSYDFTEINNLIAYFENLLEEK